MPTELCLNGGFETYTGTRDDGTADTFDSWTSTGFGGGKAEASATAKTGDCGLKITCGTTTGATGRRLTQAIAGLTSGKTYVLSFWTQGDGTYEGRYRVYDSVNSADIIAVTGTGNTATSWTQVSVEFEMPAGSDTVTLMFYGPATNTAYARFDVVSLQEKTTSNRRRRAILAMGV